MIVLLHIISAISGLATCTYLMFKPSKAKFYASYGLIGSTLVSGIYLVRSTHTPLSQVCVAGISYLLFATIAVAIATYRYKKILAPAFARNK